MADGEPTVRRHHRPASSSSLLRVTRWTDVSPHALRCERCARDPTVALWSWAFTPAAVARLPPTDVVYARGQVCYLCCTLAVRYAEDHGIATWVDGAAAPLRPGAPLPPPPPDNDAAWSRVTERGAVWWYLRSRTSGGCARTSGECDRCANPDGYPVYTVGTYSGHRPGGRSPPAANFAVTEDDGRPRCCLCLEMRLGPEARARGEDVLNGDRDRVVAAPPECGLQRRLREGGSAVPSSSSASLCACCGGAGRVPMTGGVPCPVCAGTGIVG